MVAPRPRRDDAPKGAPSIFCFRRAIEDDRMVGFRRKRGSARFTGSFPSFCCNFRIFPAPSATKRRRAPPSAAFSATYAAVRRENIAIRHGGGKGPCKTRRIFFYILLMSLLIEPFLGKYPHDPRFFSTEALYRLLFTCFPLCFAFCLIMLPLCGAERLFPSYA